MFETPILRTSMKTVGACAVLATLLAGPVMAKDLNVDLQDAPSSALGEAATHEDDPIATAKLIVGREIVNQDGDAIGDVIDIVREKVSRVLYAVVTVDRSVGKSKNITIPFADLEVMPEEVIVQSKLGADDYAVMPAYTPSDFKSVIQAG